MATDAPKSATPTLTSPEAEDHPADAPKASAGRGANWKANETHVLPKNNLPLVSVPLRVHSPLNLIFVPGLHVTHAHGIPGCPRSGALNLLSSLSPAY